MMTTKGIATFDSLQINKTGLFFIEAHCKDMVPTPTYSIIVSEPPPAVVIVAPDTTLVCKYLETLKAYIENPYFDTTYQCDLYIEDEFIKSSPVVNGLTEFQIVFKYPGNIVVEIKYANVSSFIEVKVQPSDNQDSLCMQAGTSDLCIKCQENAEISNGKCKIEQDTSGFALNPYILGVVIACALAGIVMVKRMKRLERRTNLNEVELS